MAGVPPTWTNPRPGEMMRAGELGTTLGYVFDSLSDWLLNPNFQNGITLGDGTGATYDPVSGVQTAAAPALLIDSDSIPPGAADTSTPGTATVTAVAGIGSVIAYWAPVLTVDGNAVANYIAEIGTDATWVATPTLTLNPVGPVVSFDGLISNTVYYVRVAAVSYAAVQGSWSANMAGTTPLVGAGDLAVNAIAAGSAVIGTAAISSAQIASLTAGQITTGTLNAQTISLGTTGGAAALESTNFVAGSAGWRIRGDGTVEFSNAVIRGATYSGTVVANSYSTHSSGTSWVAMSGGSEALSFFVGSTQIGGIANTGHGIAIQDATGASGLAVGSSAFYLYGAVGSTQGVVSGGYSSDPRPSASTGGSFNPQPIVVSLDAGSTSHQSAIQSSSTVVTLGALPTAVSYPIGYASGCTPIVVGGLGDTVGGSPIYVIVKGVGNLGFEVIGINTTSGATVTSGTVRVNWIATGYY